MRPRVAASGPMRERGAWGCLPYPPPRRETRAFGFTEGLDMIRHIEPRIERDVYRYTFIDIINVSDTQITRDLTEYQS